MRKLQRERVRESKIHDLNTYETSDLLVDRLYLRHLNKSSRKINADFAQAVRPKLKLLKDLFDFKRTGSRHGKSTAHC